MKHFFSVSVVLFFSAMVIAPAVSEPATGSAGPTIIDLSPSAASGEQDTVSHRGLNRDVPAPIAAPRAPSLLEQAGIDPEIESGETHINANQRFDVGGPVLPDAQSSIQPYLELGAGATRREDTPLLDRNGLGADVNAQIGGGTKVNVNDRIDLRLGYTRREPVGDAALNGEADDKVESGVTFKF